MEESYFSPFILVFNDIDATLLAGQSAESAGAPRFAHLSSLSEIDDWTAAEAPALLLVGHAPPARDAFALLHALRERRPSWTAPALVIADQPMARDARTRALGVREILPRAAATAEDLSCAIGNALACEALRRQANRDRAAQSLSSAEAERYRSLFENSAFGAAEFSCDGDRITRVNQKFCAIGGYAPDELIGRQVVDFIPAEELSRFIACRTAFLQGEQNAFARGTRILRKDGGVRSIRVTPRMERDASGAPLYATAIIEDVTERIAADAALRASEQRQRVFIDNGVFGAIEVALDGRILRVNKALQDIGGWSDGELPGRCALDLVHPPRREAFLKARADFINGVSDAINGVWPFLRKDGSVAFLSLQVTLMRDKHGAALYACGAVVEVTDRIKTEQALRASEARYRAFFDNGAFGAFEGELSGRFTKVNQFFADLGGYAREEMIGRSVAEFIHPDDRGKAQEARSAFALGESDSVVQTRRFLRKDGTYAWVKFRPVLLRDAEGAPAYVCGIAEDLSEEIKAEQALRRSEERLRKLGDNLPDSAVFTYVRAADGAPRLAYISAGVEKLLGVTPEEAMADPIGFLQLASPDDKVGQLEKFRTCEQRLDDFVIEAPFKRRDGRTIWLRMHSRPTLMADRVLVWDGVMTDITDRKIAELALARNEARLRAVLDGAQDGILSIDRSGEIQSANAAAAAMFGYRQDEMIGLNISALCAERGKGAGARPGAHWDQAAIADGRPRAAQGLRKDGSTFPFEMRKFKGEIDNEPLYVDFLRDLTERRLLEAQMEQLKQQRLLAMGGMAGALAHELNQPLAAIALKIETARRLTRLPRKERPFSLDATLSDALSQIGRASEIILHLRQFAARGEPDKSVQSLHALLREGCAAAPDKPPSRIDLRLEAAQDRVLVDKVQIRQLFHNLIRNAFEAMATASDPRLTISTRNDGGKTIVVDFVDTGPGVSGDVAEKLFEPLATTKPSGMGIGLSLSRAIASIHAGSLNVSSSTAQGATFTLRLPIDDAS